MTCHRKRTYSHKDKTTIELQIKLLLLFVAGGASRTGISSRTAATNLPRLILRSTEASVRLRLKYLSSLLSLF
jgi:hypothetical protein